MLKRLALVGTALIKRLDAMEKERIKRGPVPNKKYIIKKFRIMILKSAFQKSLVKITIKTLKIKYASHFLAVRSTSQKEFV